MEEESDEDITEENDEDTKANNDPSTDQLDKAAEVKDIKNEDTSVETKQTVSSEEGKAELIKRLTKATKDSMADESSNEKKEDLSIEKKDDTDSEEEEKDDADSGEEEKKEDPDWEEEDTSSQTNSKSIETPKPKK